MTRKAAERPSKAPPRKKATKARRLSKKALSARQARRRQGKTQMDLLAEFLAKPGGRSCRDVERKFGWLPHSARSAISRINGVHSKRTDRGTIYSLPEA